MINAASSTPEVLEQRSVDASIEAYKTKERSAQEPKRFSFFFRPHLSSEIARHTATSKLPSCIEAKYPISDFASGWDRPSDIQRTSHLEDAVSSSSGSAAGLGSRGGLEQSGINDPAYRGTRARIDSSADHVLPRCEAARRGAAPGPRRVSGGTSARRPKEGRDPHTTPHPGHARRIMPRAQRTLLHVALDTPAPRCATRGCASTSHADGVRSSSTVAHYAEKTPHMSRHNTAASTSSSLTCI
ncbi:hypothetical protein HPB51_025500 [Rhipicephalus microplus]|uniref:Uncharacterized protein n=1 Tax=Rhipicephalus microplus TaxID=6941 RepID=A0A9J6DED7_RHIMP|nr:hypothetical protein HPB51_025500 [Rhipicephalus microplus]